MQAIPFHRFCREILGLNLTTGQSVIAKVVFGGTQPSQLGGKERELAVQMFGTLENIPERARRTVCLRLGRGSGKTTISSAWTVYSALTQNISRCGPGDVPVAVTVAPDKQTAKLSIRMAREMMRANPSLNALVDEHDDEHILIRRPDGRRTAIEAFAASRGGSSVRGRSILTFLLDEAEFFRSADAGSFVINDRDIFGALMPRLLPGGKAIFLSTPWPVETMMSEEFDKNYGKPTTCIAVLATTLQMRGEDDTEIQEIIENELQRDPDNARREYFCEVDRLTGGEFFDHGALTLAQTKEPLWPVPRNSLYPCAAGVDLAFKSDSSTLCIVQYDGHKYRLSEAVELRPRKGQPLKPSEVLQTFSKALKAYGIKSVVSDSHYREAVREHLAAHGISLIDAPEGANGKVEVYTRVRAVLHEGLCTIPDNADGKRLINQARTITSKPTPGGGLTIRAPRRSGVAHGDLVSAWTLAVHALAHRKVQEERGKKPTHGSQEWFEYIARRDYEADLKREKAHIKRLEAEAKQDERNRRMGIYGRRLLD